MKFFFAGMATVAVSAVAATTFVPSPRTVAMDVAVMAAIDESNTTIGIADSDLYFESPAQIDAALDQMQAMGVSSVRVGIPWAGVNPVPGYYDWSQSDYLINAADARGMGVLAVITTTPGYAQNGSGFYSAPTSPAAFGRFAGLAADRYAGKVGAYEIWNEPNAAPFYGPRPDPAGYTDLLKAAYPTIKAADPDATVVGGVVGSTITYQNLTLNPVTFVDQMYDSGAQGYFDALSFHPYQYTMPFSAGGYHPDSPLNQLADIRDLMVTNGDTEKLVWASEYGQPTSVSSDAEQAAYLQDMLTTWRTLDYTGPTFVYTLEDDQTGSSDPEATFGLIRSDGTWKPAAHVVQDLANSPSTTPATSRTALTAMAEPTLVEPKLVLPKLTEPTLTESTLSEPTLSEPTLSEPTAPSSPVETTPTSVVDRVRSVDQAEPSESARMPAAAAKPTATRKPAESARTDRSQARQDRSEARQDRSDRKSADRERPRHDRQRERSTSRQADHTTHLPRRARDRMSHK